MAAITNNPTFNKNNNNGQFPGFYSRALFSYAPYINIPNLLGNNDSDWITDSTWNGIGDLLTNYSDTCHGSNILPAYYWCPGKTIRITGDLSVNIPQQEFINKTLNLRFGLIETSTPATTALAIQNNNNNHDLAFDAAASLYNNVPIHFECTIMCAKIDEGQDPPCTFYANGFYYYDFTNYNSSGNNAGSKERTLYVPVWKTGNGSTTLDQLYYTSATKIMMNFYGSLIGNGDDGYGAIYLSKLLIEELA